MTECEMLELAARAAGIECGADRKDCGISLTGKDGRHTYLPMWNPLTDDGDALRLAVALRMDVTFSDMYVMAFPSDRSEGCAEPINVDDPTSATRRAIVRAAAEIGRSKHE